LEIFHEAFSPLCDLRIRVWRGIGAGAGRRHSTAAGGAPAEKAQMKTDMKKDGAMPMAGGGMSGGSMAKGNMAMGGMGMGMGMKMDMKMMDTNGDGMISKKEWMDYHAKMWGRMKSKNGMMSMADMEAMMKGGPN
jgi:hypothetical protein